MRRGELYRVSRPNSRDPKKSRAFAVVGRQIPIESKFSTVICAPIYTTFEGLTTQVPIGIKQGMKLDCAIHCDELVSIPESMLVDFVGMLLRDEMAALQLDVD